MILLFAKFGVVVGITVGIAVGIVVGFNVEVTAGVAVGFNVGVAVGTTVGVGVGFNVGVVVGTTVGVGVGSSPSNSKTSVGPCASVPLYSFDAITCSRPVPVHNVNVIKLSVHFSFITSVTSNDISL